MKDIVGRKDISLSSINTLLFKLGNNYKNIA